jgi:hypothetical protein
MQTDLGVVVAHRTATQYLRSNWAASDDGTAQLLQLSNAACMIEVYMRVQNQLHVFDLETERSDIAGDLLSSLGHGTIDQNVSLIRSDKD